MVLRAAEAQPSEARQALSELCTTYWYPLYTFLRRQGHTPHDAEDLTQAFLTDLISRSALGGVDPIKGRFRSFLIASLKNFLSHERERAGAAKRGGGVPPLALDGMHPEERYATEPSDALSPDKLYDRRWALTVLELALARVRAHYELRGASETFALLSPLLTGGGGRPYAELAAQLGTTEGAVKVTVHRLRQQYREALRQEVSETVASLEHVDAELRHLIAALGP
jgi:RNA polymerase sigma-70 factor (ECF subfamily)